MGGAGVRIDAAEGSRGRGRGRGAVGGRGRNTFEGFVTNNRHQKHKKNRIAKNIASKASIDAQNLTIEDLKHQLTQMQQQMNSQ